MSILPDISNGENWVALKNNESATPNMTTAELINLIQKDRNNKFFGFNIIKKSENGVLYAAPASLFELFHLDNYSAPMLSGNGTINTSENKITIKDFYENFKNDFGDKSIFPLDVRKKDMMQGNTHNFVYKQYLSKEFFIKTHKSYQFWTFNDWIVMDGYNYQRGIDRFVYIPKLGIVGGSYDFYFELKPRNIFTTNFLMPVSKESLWSNTLSEKVMLAEELK